MAISFYNYNNHKTFEISVTEKVEIGECIVFFNTQAETEFYCIRLEENKWKIFEISRLKNQISSFYRNDNDIAHYFCGDNEILDKEKTQKMFDYLDKIEQLTKKLFKFWNGDYNYIRNSQDW